MNRFHLMMIFSIIVASTLFSLYLRAAQVNAYQEEKENLKESVEFATLAAMHELKNEQGSQTAVRNVVDKYFVCFALANKTIKEEGYFFTPAIVIMENNGFYICYPTDEGYYIPKTSELVPYSSANPAIKETITLDGEVFINGRYDHVESTKDRIRSFVQYSVEKAVRERMDILNDMLERPRYAYELTSDIIVEPNRSIVVVVQGYPSVFEDEYYEMVVQTSGQIKGY